MYREIPLRITVLDPPAGVTFCLQRGKKQDDLVSPTRHTEDRLEFDFTVRVSPELRYGRPSFLGPLTQGSPAERFVYVNSGTLAGQPGSCWTRRAKVKLAGISGEMVEAVLAEPEAILEAQIAGTARDGGPACATVPLLDGAWKIVPR